MSAPPPEGTAAPRIGAPAMFLTFSQISLSGFGGTMFWTRRKVVDQLRWMNDREFVEMLAVGQLLPGANIINLTVMIGLRFGGAAGTVAALAGLLIWPFLIVFSLGLAYQQFGDLPLIQRALSGVSAVAAGLVVANGVTFASVLPRRWRPWTFLALTFVCVGVLRWPLLAVLAVLGTAAVLAARREAR